MTKKKHGSSIQKRLIPSYIFLVIVSFISVFPFFWMISAATNKSIDVARGRIAFGGYALENLKKLFASQNVALGMKNSLINATVQTIIALLVCSLAGYGFELYHDKAKDAGLKTVIASTASPYKFTRSVMDAIDKEKYDSMTDFELVDELNALSGVKILNTIEEIRTAPIRHDIVCDKSEMQMTVEKILGL